MTTWEYRTVPTMLGVDGSPQNPAALSLAGAEAASAWLERLNALGADGWEVVAPVVLTSQPGLNTTEERSILLRRPARAAAAVTGD